MINQYLSVKANYPDALLFFRMGDFYEMFFEDAQAASQLLEITLTSRNKNDETPVPMCGVPVKAVKGYIARLIEKGRKVAICDQVEDPSQAKGLVKRDVVQVITPGMIVDPELLDAKSDNFVLALYRHRQLLGLAYLDISTGGFRLAESPQPATVLDEITRVDPREILMPKALEGDPLVGAVTRSLPDRSVAFVDNREFDPKTGRERLIEQFNTVTLEGFGCEGMNAALGAAGALLYYVRETQKKATGHLSRIEPYVLGDFLLIDDLSCRNLELLANLRSGTRKGSLISVLDETVTSLGGRLLKRWLRYPLRDGVRISQRLDAVEEALAQKAARRRVRERLKSIYDLERLAGKAAMKHANARDLTALKTSLLALPELWANLDPFEADLLRPDIDLTPLTRLAGLIESAIREDAPPTLNEGGLIRPGYHAGLDELIAVSQDARGWIARLETEEKEKTGISSLKVRYNKVFGYYIEVPKTQVKAVPPHYVRKQTLVNAERYITDELKVFEAKVLGAQEQRSTLEYELFAAVRDQAGAEHAPIQAAARFLARADCLLSLAEVADQQQYVRPSLHTDGVLSIEDGRHPVVEQLLTGGRFIPNSIRMDNTENQVIVITGPNMAGKSTVLRQIALTVLMAQVGSFVPAARAVIPVTDRIFTRVGALDNLAAGQSTFMVEMEETANILNNATSQSLVIMDEIGRGTSTYDGLSIAWAVAEYLHDLSDTGVKTLFATHYHELTELARTRPRVKNFNIAVKEWNDEIIFLRKLVEGSTNRSYGIQVARLAGLPPDVVRRAKEILYGIEKANGQHTIRAPQRADAAPPPPKGHVQLSLFGSSREMILSRLQEADIANMTPLEALNLLSELKAKANTITP